MSFSKILIANRGEIACRIMRTARALGYGTVAVYSDADRHAAHVALADEAVHIGAAPAADSYLNSAALLHAARSTSADAVHPGYGFLSENAAFAQACVDAGLVFIGPPPQAIAAMGHKALAKRRMLDAGVPCVPGYLGAEQGDAVLAAEAERLGYPLLVKAVAGGGGRGMRTVRAAAELQAAIDGARREAQSAFGDGTLMLERLVNHGRHIEIQVFADQHGQAVHLGERDCTAQRRRQKVIEEAPSPVVTPALRAAMGRDAVAAALAVGYQGAGTVEFMVDAALNHYFLEMNTRLQVEHPVTEMLTGLDLVEWQLRVAAGEPLPATQAQITFKGHAIEARLYAEDPYAGFAPQTGRVLWWQPQAALQDGVRIDHALVQGGSISPYYDPMVAKVIVHGRDRPDAIRRLRAALARTPLLGVNNNGRFLADLLDHPAFRQAEMSTALIDQWLESDAPLLQQPVASDAVWCLAAAVLALQDASADSATLPSAGWRPNSVAAYGLTLRCGSVQRMVRVRPSAQAVVQVTIGGHSAELQLRQGQEQGPGPGPGPGPGRLRYIRDGVERNAIAVRDAQALHLAVDGHSFVFYEVSATPGAAAPNDASRACASVAGKVTQILVAAGDVVQPGQHLVCVEAMKMEMWLSAEAAGTVTAVHAQVGTQVESGALLVEIALEPNKD